MGKINSGGRNSFYDIPEEVANVDSLAKYLKASGPVFNILKSLFGLNKSRHTGTSSKRDSEKMIHYSIENYLWQDDVEELTHGDVIYKLFNQLKDEEKSELASKICIDKQTKTIDTIHNESEMPDPSNYGIDRNQFIRNE